MDTRSILLTLSLVTLIVGVLSLMFGISIKTRISRLFAIGNGLFIFSALINRVRDFVHPFIAFVIGNVLTVIGVLIICHCIIILVTGKYILKLKQILFITILATITFVYYTYFDPNETMRIVAYSGFVGMLYGFTTYYAIKYRIERPVFRFSNIILGIIFGFVAMNVVRIFSVLDILLSQETTYFGIPLTTIYLITLSLFYIAWTLQILMMLVKQAEYELLLLNKGLEAKVKERTAEIEISLVNLKQTQEQLISSEKFAVIGKLVVGFAHAINTPLGTSITVASYLKDETESIENLYDSKKMTKTNMETYFTTIGDSADILGSNLSRISETVESFKMLVVDQASEQKKKIKFREYLFYIINSLQSELESIACSIKVECAEDFEIETYPLSFYFVMVNLLVNSIKHGYKDLDDCEISLEVIENEDSLILNYRDNGRGIEKEQMSSIFEPFYTTDRSSGNLGLGLYIVRSLLEFNLRGNINAISTDKGVHFQIELPRYYN